ncbi:MAG TPA: VOC family protein [Pyrinomonadaceae bacterium]|nr:VOC family protein [Pyrinomonadaceae bacterium]
MNVPIPIGPTLNEIGQIFVNVKDLDRAIAFYRDTLGHDVSVPGSAEHGLL